MWQWARQQNSASEHTMSQSNLLMGRNILTYNTQNSQFSLITLNTQSYLRQCHCCITMGRNFTITVNQPHA